LLELVADLHEVPCFAWRRVCQYGRLGCL
jgi:hypothetical protein